MPRLVDADALLEGRQDHEMISTHLIWNAPTIDAEPVRHGEWLEPDRDGSYTYDKRAYAKCSACGGVEFLGYGKKYCPNCGARMDGGEE